MPTMCSSTNQHSRRFNGVAHLYGKDALDHFGKAHIIIIGIGGVGSWVVEALARNAIGKLTLIDMDVVAESNINRQLPALTSTLGKNKIDVMKQRVQDINPQCEVVCIDDFIHQDNLQELISNDADFVIDCIDSSKVKASLIYHCKRRKIPIITLGGAGGQTNPELIKTADLSRTEHDPLLSKTRKLLRKNYNFPTNLKRRFGIPCIYSTEHLTYPGNESTKSTIKTNLSCAGGIGSSVMVTGTFGFMAVAYVLKKICN
jgi:tRNA A37 threonylcarbamoyladenosine dehydratase